MRDWRVSGWWLWNGMLTIEKSDGYQRIHTVREAGLTSDAGASGERRSFSPDPPSCSSGYHLKAESHPRELELTYYHDPS